MMTVMAKRNSLSILAENLESVIERMGDDSRASMWIQLLTKEDRRRLSEKLAIEAVEVVLGRVSLKLSALQDDDAIGNKGLVLSSEEAMKEILRDWET